MSKKRTSAEAKPATNTDADLAALRDERPQMSEADKDAIKRQKEGLPPRPRQLVTPAEWQSLHDAAALIEKREAYAAIAPGLFAKIPADWSPMPELSEQELELATWIAGAGYAVVHMVFMPNRKFIRGEWGLTPSGIEALPLLAGPLKGELIGAVLYAQPAGRVSIESHTARPGARAGQRKNTKELREYIWGHPSGDAKEILQDIKIKIANDKPLWRSPTLKTVRNILSNKPK